VTGDLVMIFPVLGSMKNKFPPLVEASTISYTNESYKIKRMTYHKQELLNTLHACSLPCEDTHIIMTDFTLITGIIIVIIETIHYKCRTAI
jgi:hypothetical protein